jgi:hypothetical protein
MIIIPFILDSTDSPSGLFRVTEPAKSLLSEKGTPLFAVNAPEFPKMPETPPRHGSQVHNESLWITVGIHMNGRNM